MCLAQNMMKQTQSNHFQISRMKIFFLVACILSVLGNVNSFSVGSRTPMVVNRLSSVTVKTSTQTQMIPDNALQFPTTSLEISADTIDPTTILSQVLGGLMDSNIILAVPILAASGVAGLLVWGIFAYASPADPDV